jgi:polysaccharide export outer membrane protein
MKKTSLFVLFLLLILSSCVTQKDLIYLQNDGTSPSTLPINEIQNKPYRVQTNDMLSIKVKTIDPKINELFTLTTNNQSGMLQQAEQGLYFSGYNVDSQGFIRLPVIGKMSVIGMTLEEIRDQIENKLLEDFLTKESNLFVTVKMAGIRYIINGEIGSPGINFIYNDKATIMDAIANSGDITMLGNRKEVMIYRQFPYGTETYSIDLTNINAMNSPQFFIQPNDFIYVKPLKQKTLGTGTTGMQTITTIISVVTLLTTTFLLINR